MKQLIPQSKIDEALDKAYSSTKENAYFGSGFNQGVQFALNEIQPFICEFIEQVIGDGWILMADGWQNVMDYKISELERRTTQQLLEEFINYKK